MIDKKFIFEIVGFLLRISRKLVCLRFGIGWIVCELKIVVFVVNLLV